MKKLIIILLSALTLTGFAQQKKVAVYVTGEQSGISKVLGDQLVAAFANSGKYTAIERTSNFLAELGKEHSYQRSGAVNNNEIARLGIQFGVNYVCVADVSDAFGEKYVSARMIDVETAEVIMATNASSAMNNMSDLLAVTNKITYDFTAPSREEREEAEAKQQALKKQREEEIDKNKRESKIKQTLAKGYIQVGALYVTYPAVSYEMWEEAKETTKKCYAGGWRDWRIPTRTEMQSVRDKLSGQSSEYDVECRYLNNLSSSDYKIFVNASAWTQRGEQVGGFYREKKAYVILVRDSWR